MIAPRLVAFADASNALQLTLALCHCQPSKDKLDGVIIDRGLHTRIFRLGKADMGSKCTHLAEAGQRVPDRS